MYLFLPYQGDNSKADREDPDQFYLSSALITFRLDLEKPGLSHVIRQCTSRISNPSLNRKMADQGKSNFRAVFTTSLCAFELKQMLISLLFQVIRLLN